MLAPVGEGVGANWDARSPAPPPKSGGKRKGGGGNGGNNGTWSPRSCLLVRDFLVPCLDSGCYGDDLQWLNRRRGVFLIRWTHQGSKSFNREGPNVFRDWSILKRKWDEHDPNRLSKAKQRVRAAFRKLPNVRRINDGAAPHRIYRIKDIGVYLKPWKEPKEKKRKKKPRQPCGCAPGDPSCRHMPRGHSEQEQGAASSTGAEEDDDDDDDYNYMEDGEEDCGGEDYEAPVDSKSAVSLSANGSVWSSLHSLTEEVSVSREVVAGEDHQDESSLSPSWGPADMEAVQALLSIRHGRPLPPMTAPTQAPPVAPPGGGGGAVALQSSQPTTALTTTASGMDATAAPRTEAKDQSTVSAELRVTSNGVAPPPADGEASLAPHSVHVFKELLAAALSSAPRPAQPATVTGDSPHMFWADAAPARHGEQPPQKQLHTMAAASVKGPCLQDFGIESEPVPSYEAAKGTAVVPCSVATGAATHSGGWTDQPSAYSSSSSSWLDRNEPLRPDGCWTTR